MIPKNILLYFFGILACLVLKTVADEAIIGGHKVGIDQFPYQVSLVSSDGMNICGGGILGERYVLTAAHCVIVTNNKFKGIPIFIVAGTINLNGRSVRTVRVQVKKIYVPREYNDPPHTSTGDIAVLKLKDSLELETRHKYLKPLQLPTDIHETYANKLAHVAGFGWTSVYFDGEVKSGKNDDNHLRFSEADIISNEQCILDVPLHTFFSHQKLCARIHQKNDHQLHGTCIGDSGAPLLHGDVVVGVLSLGPVSCSERILPSIYTRVTEYLDFIQRAMKDKTQGMQVFKAL